MPNSGVARLTIGIDTNAAITRPAVKITAAFCLRIALASRGGRNRKKKPAAASQNGADAATDGEAAPEAEESTSNGEFDYVPMSEWADELEAKG